MAASPEEITVLLRAAQNGDKHAEARLLPLIYPELRRLARRQMRKERSDHTLQPTALVHEAYLRLTLQHERTWECRAHFLAIAANLMRQVLIDHARARLREKRGGGELTACLDDQIAEVNLKPVEVIELDECLNRLTKIDARQGRVVEMRFFGGLSVDEVAYQLAVSPKTVKRDWQLARAWLYRELRRTDGTSKRALGESQEPVRRRTGAVSGRA
jgi:RNA polymerase sigma-70 factor, ECF subfamily